MMVSWDLPRIMGSSWRFSWSFLFGRRLLMADRVRGPRQRKHWHSLGSSTVAALTGAGTTLLDSLSDADNDPFTVLRLIGELVIAENDTGIVVADACQITVGIGVVSTDAAAVGSTAMPDPAAEADYPWLWWYAGSFLFPEASLGVRGGTAGQARIRIESSAMRKVGPRQSLVAVVEYVNAVGDPPMDMLFSTRVLVGTT